MIARAGERIVSGFAQSRPLLDGHYLRSPRERTARTMAIKGTRQVYESVEKVLVLDSSLRTLDSAMAHEDLLLRLHVAPWSTRWWMPHSFLGQCLKTSGAR